MKKVYLLFIVLMIETILSAQKEIPITSTENLSINTSIPVMIYKSDSPKVIIKGEKLNPDAVIVTAGPDGLSITPSQGKYNLENCVIEIYTNNLKNITVSGASTVNIKDEFTVPHFNVVVSGSSELKGNILSEKANITATGASDVNLTGSAEEILAVGSGSSELRLIDFPAKTVHVTVSGASDAYVDATETLNADASGAGDIYYKNEPAKMNVNTSGASDVRKYDGSKTYHDDYNDNYNYNDNDSTDKKKRRFAARPKDMFGGGRYHQDLVWMGIDLGMDGLIDLSNGFDFQPQGDYNFMEMNYWRNTHVRLNFFEWRFNLVKNVFNIITGLGWDFQHYAFTQKIRFDEADDYPGQTFPTPVIGITDSTHSINRSRLAVQYFNIPLFFNLRTKKTDKHRQQFNFTFGVVGGIKTGSSSRIMYTENSYDAKEEKYDDFNLETFTATAMVRIKYSFFSIYASYQFTPMFRGQNPNLYPFTIGVTLLSW